MTPYHPDKLPVKPDYAKFARKLADAEFALGRLGTLHSELRNPLLLLAPLTAKEAAVSSKIEGTQSSVSDVFLHEVGEGTKYHDVIEVSNYKRAMEYSIGQLKNRPLSQGLVKEIHGMLLEGVRGEGKRGQYREEQVWVGQTGDAIERATYVPPENIFVQEYMDNLETYLNSDSDDALIQGAIFHYQFEAVHPFNDGNGRIGRLLIPLLLHYKRKIDFPILYLSGYFEKSRNRYIEALHRVDTNKDYEFWIDYFLSAVIEQATQTQNLIRAILSLHEKIKTETEQLKSPYISRLVDYLFKSPVFNTSMVKRDLKANRSTVLRLIVILEGMGVIKKLNVRKNRTYVFTELIGLL